jgi:NADPH:quinone reductase-like Zn-dependent oxidoreductase
MRQSGMLVVDWPLTPGCDAGGVVVKAGAKATSPLGGLFKEGDRVIGCTRLGSKGHSPFAEFFLLDAQVALPLPDNLSLAEGSTLGVATYV